MLPLEKAKWYLNIPAERTTDDDELTEFIAPAVQRVGQHVGRELVDEQSCTPLELLAVKVVLGAYWRTQRVNMGRGGSYGGGVSGSALEADSDPAGVAPIRRRLIDLLGDPADDGTGQAAAPQGCFPPAESWPDPAYRGRETA